MRRMVHGTVRNRWGRGRRLVWMLGLACAAVLAFGSTGPAYAVNYGTGIPSLGIGAVGDGKYQFISGAYYTVSGGNVSEGSVDNWNLLWTGDSSSGTLKLNNAKITDTLYVPGNTRIEILGDCSILTNTTSIQQEIAGDMTVDIADGSTLTLKALHECLYSGDGDMHLTGAGKMTFEHEGSTAITCDGILTIDGALSVKGLDIPAGSTAGALNAGRINIAGSANVDVIGRVSTEYPSSSESNVDGTLHVEDNAKLVVSTSVATGAAISGSKGIYVSKDATIISTATATKNAPALSSMYGPIVIDGTVKVSSAASGNGALTAGISDMPAHDIDIAGTVVVEKASNGIMNVAGDTNIKPGAKVTIKNATIGIFQPVGGNLVITGASLVISDAQIGIASASAEGMKSFIKIENESDVRLDTSSIGIYDPQSGKTGSAIELANSGLVASSGVGVSNMVPSLSYTKDAGAAVGDDASSAQPVALDKINFTNRYVSITTTDHAWASEWTTNDTHHWHACTNSHCTLDSAADIAQMGNYAEHSGGTATCIAKASCVACGKEYGSVNASNHVNLVKTAARPASHLASGNIAYWHCEGCSKYFSDEAGTKEIALKDTVIPRMSGHSADSTGWHSDATEHWKTCICGAKLNKSAHAFVWVIDKYPTATEVGSKHEECETCGYARTSVEIPVPFFSDVVPGSWYAEPVAFVAGRGLIVGYDNSDLFGVGHTLTRGELATILWRHATDPSKGFDSSASVNKTDMPDISDGKFYTEAANWAVENGVISGYEMPDGSRRFGPNDPVTLEQMVAIIGNLTADKGEVADADLSALDRYADKAGISAWAVKSVAWATKVGLVNGNEVAEGTREVRATESVARERAAGVLYNAFTIGLME